MKLWVDDIRRPPDASWAWARTNAEAIEIHSWNRDGAHRMAKLFEMHGHRAHVRPYGGRPT